MMKFLLLFLISTSVFAQDVELPEEDIEAGEISSLPCSMSYVSGSPDNIESDENEKPKSKSSSTSAAAQ